MIFRFTKRTVDIFGSLIGLIALSLPLSILAILIKLDSRGPVFFRQQRAGKGGKTFLIWKFRTMVDGATKIGMGLNTGSSDPRITRTGRILREWSLDELPQLINVLTGDMSLVGPRPTLPYQIVQYTPEQRRRLDMRPGVTSLAAVSGRNLLSWEQRIRLDVKYVQSASLWSDIRIMFKSLWVAFVRRDGLYGAGGVNDPFTRGSEATGAGQGPKGVPARPAQDARELEKAGPLSPSAEASRPADGGVRHGRP